MASDGFVTGPCQEENEIDEINKRKIRCLIENLEKKKRKKRNTKERVRVRSGSRKGEANEE
jgi:hypothetical protein